MTKHILLSSQPRRAVPDAAGRMVVTPNPRAARALGAEFVSLEGLARRTLRRHGLMVATEIVQRHTLREAVRDVLTPPDLTGVTRVVGATVQEVLRAGFPYLGPEGSLSDRAESLLELTTHYRDALHKQRLLDPAEVLWAAAEASAMEVKAEALLVAGYPRVGRGETAFLRAAAGEGSAFILPTGAHPCFSLNAPTVEELRGAGWVVEHHGAGDAPFEGMAGGTSPPRALRFASQEDEVRYVLTRVKELLHTGHAPATVALVARDDALYGPLLHAVAWEYEIPVKASYARPLRETRFGAWLELLVTVLREGFPFEETARLLAHPLCARLPREVWAHLRKGRSRGSRAWLEALPELGCLVLPAGASYAERVDALHAALAHLGVSERATLDARDAAAFYKAQNALESLKAVPTPATASPEAFLEDLSELLSLLTLPADSGVRGVELHTPLAVFGAHYEHVFVLGAAEGVLPAALRDDPVLDFYERRALARAGLELEGAGGAAHRETLSFWAALQSARATLTLSYPERLGERALLPSPYFALLGLGPGTPAYKAPASPEELRRVLLQGGAVDTVDKDLDKDDVLKATRHAWAVERRRESAAAPDLYDGVTDIPTDPNGWVFSASQLVTLGSCPFHWFAAKLLGLGEAEEADDDLSPALRGTLYHAVLEAALRPARDAADPRAAALEALEDAFAEAEAEVKAKTRVNITSLPGWAARRREHLGVLRRVLHAADFFRDGSVVLELEKPFEGTWHGLRVRGFVDRVDRTPDGLVFVDYKTRGSKPPGAKDAHGKRTLDLQLPLYAEAAASALFPGEPVAGATYYSLTKAKVLSEVTFDQEAHEAHAAFATRVRAHLGAGSYPVEPDAARTACAYCDFDLVCRVGARAERKRAGATL